MAALAYDATAPLLCLGLGPAAPVAAGLLGIDRPGRSSLLLDSGRDDTEGNPAPCLKVARYGSFSFRLACATGDRELTVQVKQPDSSAVRPYMTVRANASIGVAAATATADASTGWQNLTLNFTATGDGGVWVELWNADPGKPCWFDNLSLT